MYQQIKTYLIEEMEENETTVPKKNVTSIMLVAQKKDIVTLIDVQQLLENVNNDHNRYSGLEDRKYIYLNQDLLKLQT